MLESKLSAETSKNKENSSVTEWSHFLLDVPVRNLLSSMADSLSCDRQLQRAHWSQEMDFIKLDSVVDYVHALFPAR